MGLQKKLQDHSRLISTQSWLNKYSIAIIAFVVWLSFFDNYNFITQFRLSHSISELDDKKEYYEKELENALAEREVINNDIEKYAREKYLMHKDNEQIIIIK